MKKCFIFAVLMALVSCKEQTNSLTAQKVVDKSIEASGGYLLDNATASFDFRGKHYSATRYGGAYVLDRFTVDSTQAVCDQLSNQGFMRFVDAQPVKVADSLASRFGESVNSVHYFAYLPYGLNDAAVNKELLGERTVEGRNYYLVQITFSEQGGGTDFDDVFLYWIDKENFKVDYLAYEYHTNGGGMRFRVAYNERFTNGVRFVDYKNYKPTAKDVSILELDSLYEADQLELLSTIDLQNISVDVCETC